MTAGPNPASRGIFASPPVIEVALSVAFEPLPDFGIALLGELYGEFRSRFPRQEEQGRFEMPIEVLDAPQAAPEATFRFFQTPPTPRLWFLDADGRHLVQVQNTLFARNWRRITSDDDYPRYQVIRDAFESDISVFQTFLDARGIGPIRATQCELTYINHVPSPNNPGELGEIFAFIDDGRLRPVEPEAIRFVVDSPINSDGKAIGRLHVSGEPATLKIGGQPIVVLTLTGRGAPIAADIDGTLAFMDLAHAKALQAFVAMTTEQMHSRWGQS